MTVGVHTPTGKLWHLAGSRDDYRTYCGLTFSDGYDTIEELGGLPRKKIPESELCSSCESVRSRRRARGIRS